MTPSSKINFFFRMTRIAPLSVVAAVLLLSSFQTATANAEEGKEVSAKSKKLTAIGSDSMGTLMRRWVDSYSAKDSEVSMQVVSRGSATAPAALLEGMADLGPMARPMKTTELSQFRSRYGFEPTQIRTAVAATVILVSAENPIEKISLKELDSIFSIARKRGGELISRWEQVGVKNGFAKERIVPLGLEVDSQTASYFR